MILLSHCKGDAYIIFCHKKTAPRLLLERFLKLKNQWSKAFIMSRTMTNIPTENIKTAAKNK
jgi:hypothetical protein